MSFSNGKMAFKRINLLLLEDFGCFEIPDSDRFYKVLKANSEIQSLISKGFAKLKINFSNLREFKTRLRYEIGLQIFGSWSMVDDG